MHGRIFCSDNFDLVSSHETPSPKAPRIKRN
jgi:hypothetical protein